MPPPTSWKPLVLGLWGRRVAPDPVRGLAFLWPVLLGSRPPLSWLLSASSNLSQVKKHPWLRVSLCTLLPRLCLSLSPLLCPPPLFFSQKIMIISEHSLRGAPHTSRPSPWAHRGRERPQLSGDAAGQYAHRDRDTPKCGKVWCSLSAERGARQGSKARLLSPECPALNSPGLSGGSSPGLAPGRGIPDVQLLRWGTPQNQFIR